ncbi:hypothetical protein PR048_020267 [Dryococelus australis]|uniref:Uncharacterized protein n=1 Tax=Dryococelus australis TaxID=614101 RepID=A0ABQ9H5U5_9NEOP|nr:hypothetical protein PR048_020267 [Dryococelus australis]
MSAQKSEDGLCAMTKLPGFLASSAGSSLLSISLCGHSDGPRRNMDGSPTSRAHVPLTCWTTIAARGRANGGRNWSRNAGVMIGGIRTRGRNLLHEATIAGTAENLISGTITEQNFYIINIMALADDILSTPKITVYSNRQLFLPLLDTGCSKSCVVETIVHKQKL